MEDKEAPKVDPRELARLTESLAKLTRTYENARESAEGQGVPTEPLKR